MAIKFGISSVGRKGDSFSSCFDDFGKFVWKKLRLIFVSHEGFDIQVGDV